MDPSAAFPILLLMLSGRYRPDPETSGRSAESGQTNKREGQVRYGPER
jgi:hypothetical protein